MGPEVRVVADVELLVERRVAEHAAEDPFDP